MMRHDRYLLAGALILALAILIVPVAAAPTFTDITPASGVIAGGTTVTITGTEFTNTTAVTFGGTAATSFEATSDTTLTAIVPAHAAGAVDVVITAPEGTVTSSGAYTYVAAPTITSVTPSFGYNSSTINNVVILGTGFSTSGATVVLSKTGRTNISGTINSAATNQLTCSFAITGKEAGYWNVIVTNSDGQYATRTSGFEIKTSSGDVTVTSVTPSSAVTNTTVSITNLAGTGFTGTPQVYLKRTGYNYIYGTFSLTSSTKLTGSFNLTNQVPGSYEVCVLNSGSDAVCDPTFTILSATAVNGSIYFTSSPSNAVVWVDNVNRGNTPFTLYNVTPGSHSIKIQKASYADWTKSVTVTAGNEETVSASLTYVSATTTAPTATAIIVTTATLPPTTVKSTAYVPTPWPSDTPTPQSPVGVLVIIGALATGMVVLRKNQ